MKVQYWIKDESGWHRIDREEYFTFNGEKELRPSTWGLFIVQELLLPYRYM